MSHGKEHMFKKVYTAVAAALLMGGMSASSAMAAAPDGNGPWADSVVNAMQGMTKAGVAVPAERSNPDSALGVAEETLQNGTFYSLGFGGKLTLGFQNGISSGAFVVESTNPGYPTEKAMVEVSQDGTTWYPAGNLNQSGEVALPDQVECGKFVRITDMSNPADFADAAADAYDVDGVKAVGNSCTTDGRMTGGGSIVNANGMKTTHGFTTKCSVADSPNNLEINWDKGNKFHLTSMTSVLCTDDPALVATPPKAGFDTQMGTGMGNYNGKPGYKVEWTFTDAGEPGKNDWAKIVIKDPSNAVVFSTEGMLKNGNHQAH